MLLKGEQLTSHLERGLKPVYVLYGDDPLLVIEAADQIRQKAKAAGFDEREVLTALSGFDWGQLLAAGNSMSLFGGRKLIDLRIPSGKPGREGSQALQAYCRHLSPDNLLLLTLPQLDWKEEKAVWLTSLGESGVIIKLISPPLGELPGWIAARLRRQQQKTSQEALVFMAERVEGNLLAAHQEIQKLALLYPPGELSVAQIRDAVLNVARYRLDDLRTALLSGELGRYARTLEGLRQEGEPLPLVLWAVGEEIRALAALRQTMDDGKTPENQYKTLKIWGQRQTAIRAALNRLNGPLLRAAMRQLFEADQSAKGVGGDSRTNAWEILLRLGMSLSQASTKHRPPRPPG